MMPRRGTPQDGHSGKRQEPGSHERPSTERREPISSLRPAPPSSSSMRPGPPSESSPTSRPPPSRKVRTIDILVQGATVELFHFYGVAIAPADPGECREEARAHADPASMIEFSARGFSGVLALSANPAVFRAMTGLPPMPEGFGDWMREVANQLMGKIKSRLARFQIVLNTELPQLRSPGDVDRRSRSCKQQFCYSFRTLKGDVFVTMSGDFDDSSLVFSNASPLPLDGKVILF